MEVLEAAYYWPNVTAKQSNKFRALNGYYLKKGTKRIFYFFARIFVKIHYWFLRKFDAKI
jgi:hypothetical protein